MSTEWDRPDEDDNFDGWNEASVPARALFPEWDARFDSAEKALEHARAQGCDLHALVSRLHLDAFQVIRLINYIRRPTTQPRPTPESIMSLTGHEAFLTDDNEMKPVPGYEEDGLLQYDLAEESERMDTATELKILREAYDELRHRYAERFGITAAVAQDAAAEQVSAPAPQPIDRHYFESYAGHDIHQTMIGDSVDRKSVV